MKITLNHNNQTIEANESESLLAQLKSNGFTIKSTCGGCASCGACIVQIVAGEDHLQEPTFEEKQLIGNVFHITKERLACQTYLTGDVTIDISKHIEAALPKKLVTVRRTKEESVQIKETKKEERKERNANRPKKLGGGKKPKAFTFKGDEEI